MNLRKISVNEKVWAENYIITKQIIFSFMIQSLIEAFDGDFLEFKPECNFSKATTLSFLKKPKKMNDKILIIDYGFQLEKNNNKYLLVSDHINLSGQNPLIGANDNSLGERFFPLNNLYLIEQIQLSSEMQKGVLACFNTGFRPNIKENDFLTTLLPEVKAYSYNLILASLLAAHQKIKVCGLIKYLD